jgi:hypothetical protein
MNLNKFYDYISSIQSININMPRPKSTKPKTTKKSNTLLITTAFPPSTNETQVVTSSSSTSVQENTNNKSAVATTSTTTTTTTTATTVNPATGSASIEANVPKKRGRRKKIVTEKEVKKTSSSKKESKDGKLVQMVQSTQSKTRNAILHLRCSLHDIDQYIHNQTWKSDDLAYDPKIPSDILPYIGNEYHSIDNNQTVRAGQTEELVTNTIPSAYTSTVYCSKCQCDMKNETVRYDGAGPNKQYLQPTGIVLSDNNHSNGPETNSPEEELTEKDREKIKELKIQFYKQHIPDKKVDCFWCTCPYDNDPFFILQNGSEGDIVAHYSFCSPQCSVAYLFQNTHWDDSAIVESYQLMNHYYCNPYDKNENIKPACSPFYTLDKYYGNLTIQEYRKLSKSNYMLLCLEKPVSRVLPEIHEDNDKMMSSQSIRGNYKVKKQSEKNSTANRNEILKNAFGI